MKVADEALTHRLLVLIITHTLTRREAAGASPPQDTGIIPEITLDFIWSTIN